MKKVVVRKSKGIADAEQCDIHVVVKSLVCLNNYKDHLTQNKPYEIISENKHNDYRIINDLGDTKEYHRSWFDWKK
tara:strand:+ start:276 stop:503 length:228 start_codon:yes stop_codon:yes gene_type:complete